MAIQSVTEDYRGESDNATASYPFDDERLTRRFIVQFTDNPLEAGSRTMIARLSPAVPQLWEPHPNNAWTWVTQSNADYGLGAFEVIVEVVYETLEDPLSQDPVYEWLTARTSEPVDTTIDNDPILNSSDESYDPQIMKEIADKILRVTRNEASFDHQKAFDFTDAVNSAIFYDSAIGTVICKIFNGRTARAVDLRYSQVTYEFHFRQDGWLRRIRDEGFRKIIGIAPGGEPVYETLLDTGGNLLSQPSLLDGFGQPLANGATPVFRTFDLDKKQDFTQLGL